MTKPTYEELEALVTKYRARLETDYCWQYDPDAPGYARRIPVDDPDNFPDAVTCRDATIKLQDDRIKNLLDEIKRLEAENKKLIKQLRED